MFGIVVWKVKVAASVKAAVVVSLVLTVTISVLAVVVFVQVGGIRSSKMTCPAELGSRLVPVTITVHAVEPGVPPTFAVGVPAKPLPHNSDSWVAHVGGVPVGAFESKS